MGWVSFKPSSLTHQGLDEVQEHDLAYRTLVADIGRGQSSGDIADESGQVQREIQCDTGGRDRKKGITGADGIHYFLRKDRGSVRVFAIYHHRAHMTQSNS